MIQTSVENREDNLRKAMGVINAKCKSFDEALREVGFTQLINPNIYWGAMELYYEAAIKVARGEYTEGHAGLEDAMNEPGIQHVAMADKIVGDNKAFLNGTEAGLKEKLAQALSLIVRKDETNAVRDSCIAIIKTSLEAKKAHEEKVRARQAEVDKTLYNFDRLESRIQSMSPADPMYTGILEKLREAKGGYPEGTKEETNRFEEMLVRSISLMEAMGIKVKNLRT